MGFLDKIKANPMVQKGLTAAKDPENQRKAKEAAQKMAEKRRQQNLHKHRHGGYAGDGMVVMDNDDYYDPNNGDYVGNDGFQSDLDSIGGVGYQDGGFGDGGDFDTQDSGDFDDSEDYGGDE